MPVVTLDQATKTETRVDAGVRAATLSALAFFDQLDHPLTLLELHRLRYAPGGARETTVADVLAVTTDPRIGTKDGLYFLAGREELVERRLRGYRLAEPKFRKAASAVRWLRRLPSVRMIAVCNSLAMSVPDDRSDIDLFMVVRPGFLWITRLLAAGFLALTGRRPKGERHADTICLSFLVSERALDLRPLALPGGDTYLAYWTATLLPMYDPHDVLGEVRRRNGWVQDLLPGTRAAEPVSSRIVPLSRADFRPLLPVLRALEAAARRFQIARFPERIRAIMNRDTRVVVTDHVLKFHVDDARAAFERGFRERLTSLNV
jgi:hypothetical protein